MPAMPDADIAAAARRVAYDIRVGRHSLPNDLDAIRSVLDAVGAEPGEDRVERWARVCAKAGFHAWPTTDSYNDRAEKRAWGAVARAAIVLADAERAAETTKAPPG